MFKRREAIQTNSGRLNGKDQQADDQQPRLGIQAKPWTAHGIDEHVEKCLALCREDFAIFCSSAERNSNQCSGRLNGNAKTLMHNDQGVESKRYSGRPSGSDKPVEWFLALRREPRNIFDHAICVLAPRGLQTKLWTAHGNNKQLMNNNHGEESNKTSGRLTAVTNMLNNVWDCAERTSQYFCS